MQESEQAFLLIRLAMDRADLITRIGDDLFQLFLVERILADDFRPVLRAGGIDLLHVGERLAHRVVDMRFTSCR